jgi:hypothetical protein
MVHVRPGGKFNPVISRRCLFEFLECFLHGGAVINFRFANFDAVILYEQAVFTEDKSTLSFFVSASSDVKPTDSA